MLNFIYEEKEVIENVIVTLYFAPLLWVFVKAFFAEVENIKQQIEMEKETKDNDKEQA